MPITEKEKIVFEATLAKMESVELLRLTAFIYDTILAAEIKSGALMALGKMIHARVPWSDIAQVWASMDGSLTDLNQKIRLPLVRAAEEFFLKNLSSVYVITPEEKAAEPAGPPVPEKVDFSDIGAGEDGASSEEAMADAVSNEADDVAADGLEYGNVSAEDKAARKKRREERKAAKAAELVALETAAANNGEVALDPAPAIDEDDDDDDEEGEFESQPVIEVGVPIEAPAPATTVAPVIETEPAAVVVPDAHSNGTSTEPAPTEAASPTTVEPPPPIPSAPSPPVS